MFESTDMNIKSLIMFCIGGHQDMYRRSYMFNNLNSSNIDIVKDVFHTDIRTKGKVSPSTISRNLPGFLTLRNGAESKVLIPNGWDQDRIVFILTVEIKMASTYSRVYLIQGFTHEPVEGVIGYNSINPNAILHFNSITEIDCSMNPYQQMKYRVNKTYQSLRDIVSNVDQFQAQYGVPDGNRLEIFRPKDLHTLSSIDSSLSYGDDIGFTTQNKILNVGEYSTFKAEGNSRSNNDPSIYLAKVLNSYREGKNNSRISYDLSGSDSDVFHSAADEVTEPSIAEAVFIRTLQRVTGEISPTSIPLSALYSICPHLDQIRQGPNQVYDNFVITHFGTFNPLETESTKAPSEKNVKVIEMFNSITSLMLECFLWKVSFTVLVNLEHIEINCTSGNTLVGDDNFLPEACENFKSVVSRLVIPRFRRNELRSLLINVSVDFISSTVIEIKDLDDPTQSGLYAFPTWGDSLTAPVIGTHNDKQALKYDFETIYNEIL